MYAMCSCAHAFFGDSGPFCGWRQLHILAGNERKRDANKVTQMQWTEREHHRRVGQIAIANGLLKFLKR